MNRQTLPQQSIGIFLVTLFLSACSMLQTQATSSAGPNPGLWGVSDTTYDASSISFNVSDDSATISSFSMVLAGLPCGDVIIKDARITAQMNSINPWMVEGEVAPIDDDSFSIELRMSVFPNTLNIQSGLFVFVGSFTSPSEAYGTWELDLLTSGDNCSGTWTAVSAASDSE